MSETDVAESGVETLTAEFLSTWTVLYLAMSRLYKISLKRIP